MPLGNEQGFVRWLVYHLDCHLRGILRHDATCPHCRGKDLDEHPRDCPMHKGDYCNCQHNPFRDPAITEAKAND